MFSREEEREKKSFFSWAACFHNRWGAERKTKRKEEEEENIADIYSRPGKKA